MRVRYKARALNDIERIHDHIVQFDLQAAKRVVRRIEHSIARLAMWPYSGRAGVVAGTRTLVVPGLPYVAIYRVRENNVDIITVLHTARKRRS